MPDRPVSRHTREGVTGNYVLWALMLAALVAILLIGLPMFKAGEKGVDVNKAQPNVESPATGDTKKP